MAHSGFIDPAADVWVRRCKWRKTGVTAFDADGTTIDHDYKPLAASTAAKFVLADNEISLLGMQAREILSFGSDDAKLSFTNSPKLALAVRVDMGSGSYAYHACAGEDLGVMLALAHRAGVMAHPADGLLIDDVKRALACLPSIVHNNIYLRPVAEGVMPLSSNASAIKLYALATAARAGRIYVPTREVWASYSTWWTAVPFACSPRQILGRAAHDFAMDSERGGKSVLGTTIEQSEHTGYEAANSVLSYLGSPLLEEDIATWTQIPYKASEGSMEVPVVGCYIVDMGTAGRAHRWGFTEPNILYGDVSGRRVFMSAFDRVETRDGFLSPVSIISNTTAASQKPKFQSVFHAGAIAGSATGGEPGGALWHLDGTIALVEHLSTSVASLPVTYLTYVNQTEPTYDAILKKYLWDRAYTEIGSRCSEAAPLLRQGVINNASNYFAETRANAGRAYIGPVPRYGYSPAVYPSVTFAALSEADRADVIKTAYSFARHMWTAEPLTAFMTTYLAAPWAGGAAHGTLLAYPAEGDKDRVTYAYCYRDDSASRFYNLNGQPQPTDADDKYYPSYDSTRSFTNLMSEDERLSMPKRLASLAHCSIIDYVPTSASLTAAFVAMAQEKPALEIAWSIILATYTRFVTKSADIVTPISQVGGWPVLANYSGVDAQYVSLKTNALAA